MPERFDPDPSGPVNRDCRNVTHCFDCSDDDDGGEGGGGDNPEVTAFEARVIVCNGIITPDIVAALNTFVSTLKTANLWGGDKVQYVYPFVGANECSHALNLVDVDVGAISFVTILGTLVHDATGVSCDEIAYGGTSIPLSDVGGISSHHFSYYHGTNIGSNGGNDIYADGVFPMVINSAQWMDPSVDVRVLVSPHGQLGTLFHFSPTPLSGLFTMSRTAQDDLRAFIQENQTDSDTTDMLVPPYDTLDWSTNNDPVAHQVFINFVYNVSCRMVTFGGGLTPSEVATLAAAVEAFQVALGRPAT